MRHAQGVNARFASLKTTPEKLGPMTDDRLVTVRLFGVLRDTRAAAGLATTVDVEVPSEGRSARAVAHHLGLDERLIEGVFINRTVYPLDSTVRPGDRVAFVPYGTPGPHRVHLVLYRAGHQEERGDPI